jgi:hypothetical protein
MSFTYLDGKRWSQITRDERFFCQQLYELIKQETPERFLKHLHDDRALDVSVDGEWEVGFEVCFYRDLWQHRGQEGELYSPKRTFDLCLFGEKAIVIIEAKAATGFDLEQNEVFARDINEVKRLTGVDNVRLMGLCSSKYKPEADLVSVFTGPIITWKEMAVRYGDNEILLRADDVYEPQKAFSKAGRHSDSRHTGAELVDAFRNGAKWWVGRGGGLHGPRFKEDVETGRWKAHKYEVNTIAAESPSSNYFSLVDFVVAVGEQDGGQ